MNASLRRSAAMLAMSAGGIAAHGAPDDDFLPAKVETHIYLNLATGEMTRTPAGPRFGDLVWQNDDTAGSCSRFYGLDRPTRDPATGLVKFGASVANWGDLPAMSEIAGFEFAFATQRDPDTCDIPEGLRVRIGFIDRYDSGVNPGGPVTPPGGAGPAREVAAFIIGGFTGEYSCDVEFIGLIVTVDLEGSGAEFVLGDTASGSGGDLDGDGLADFAYSYTMMQADWVVKFMCGPLLVQPASLGGAGTATGVPDLLSWFNSTPDLYDGYAGDFNFGGGGCPVPFAVTYMNLYGPRPPEYCGAIDYTGDTIIDFLDYLEFLNRFDALDTSADLNGDGMVDFADWLEFYNRYHDCGG